MNLTTSNPPLMKIKKEKIKDFTEKFLLPNAKEVGWTILKTEFDYLDFCESNLFLLYKNDQPVGQFIETNFNDTICFSHFIIVKEERHKGYGHLLLEEFYNSHKNRRICCTSVNEMVEVYEKKLNLKKIKKSFNCCLEFDRKNMEQITDSISVKQVKFTNENSKKLNGLFSNFYGYHRSKAAEFYLKKGVCLISNDGTEDNGVLCATKDHNNIRIECLISDSFDVACDLFYSFLKNLSDEKYEIHMTIPENDKFKEFLKTFSINFDENNFVWILDSNLNCTYDNFYCISNATL